MWVNDPCARNVALCHIILTTCLIWWILTIPFLNVVDIINPFHRRLSFSLKTDSTNSCILCHLSGRTAEKEILKTPVDWSLPFLLRHIGFCFCFFLVIFLCLRQRSRWYYVFGLSVRPCVCTCCVSVWVTERRQSPTDLLSTSSSFLPRDAMHPRY